MFSFEQYVLFDGSIQVPLSDAHLTHPFRALFIYKMAKVQSKHNYIFISYEWVDHTAVYNYMFRPLSAIVRLYYFLL